MQKNKKQTNKKTNRKHTCLFLGAQIKLLIGHLQMVIENIHALLCSRFGSILNGFNLYYKLDSLGSLRQSFHVEASMRNSEVGMALQSCPKWRERRQEFFTPKRSVIGSSCPEKGTCPPARVFFSKKAIPEVVDN